MIIIFTLHSLKIVLSVLVLLSCSSIVVTNNEANSELDQLYSQNSLNLLTDYKEQVREQLWDALSRIKASLLEWKITDRSLEISCFDQVKSALELPINSTQFEWLLQMYDSSGSMPNGILSGTTTSLGDFDQCIRIGESNYLQETQYCLLTLRLARSAKNNSVLLNQQQNSTTITQWEREHIDKLLVTDRKVPIVIGLCLPAQCTHTEMNLIAHSSSNLVNYFDSNVQYCQTRSKDAGLSRLIETNLIPFLFVIGILSLLNSLGTFLDFLEQTKFGKDWSQKLDTFPVHFLRCFSVIHNTKLLFNLKSYSHEKEREDKVNNETNAKVKLPLRLDFINGIRVCALLGIIMVHCAAFTQVPHNMKVSLFAHYPEDIQRSTNDNFISSLISAYFHAASFAVSIFFMISGILLMYCRKENTHCNVTFHFIQHFVHRAMRMFPAFLATMGIMYYLRYLGSGPLYHEQLIEPYVEPCRTHFWYHLFMVHNYLPMNQRCGSHTWYVAADFQLHIVAFLVVHLVRCRSKWFTGLIVTIGIVAFSSLIPLLLVALGIGQLPNFDAYIDPHMRFPQLDLTLFYYSSYNHAPAFFIGVVLGYILSSGCNLSYITNNKKLIRFLIFPLCAGTLILVPLAMRYFLFPPDLMHSDTLLSPFLTMVLFQLLSYAFNFAMAGCILIMALYPKMYISECFSSASLRPISRLVYCAFLSHAMLIWFFLQQSRAVFVVNFTSITFFTIMILGASALVSVYLFLMIECPFIRIGKLVCSNQSTGTNNNKPQTSLPMMVTADQN